MKLNYCPSCGRKLDAETKYCPYCGEYLEDDIVDSNDDNYSLNYKPQDNSWINKWNDRARANKIGLIVLLLVLTPALLIPMVRILFEFDDMSALWPLAILELFVVALVIFAFVSVIKRKNIIKVMEGYTVLVFITNSQHALIVEDEMQDSQTLYHSRYHHTRPINLHGHLPNGRKIYVEFENQAHGIEIKYE